MALTEPELDELELKEKQSQKTIDKLFLVISVYVAWCALMFWVGYQIATPLSDPAVPLEALVFAKLLAIIVLVVVSFIVAVSRIVRYTHAIRQLKIEIIYLEARLTKRQKANRRAKLEAYR